MAPPITPHSKESGKYSTATIQILVGATAEPFHIHTAFLERTAFFQVHDGPDIPESRAPSPERPLNAIQSPAPSDTTLTSDETEIQKADTGDATDTETTAPVPVPTSIYHLRGPIFEPAAFEIVVDYLYNQPPTTPLDRDRFRVMSKAYILALHYHIEGLQDELVDCLRKFHSSYTMHSEDLLWMTKRLGGHEAGVCKVPMVRYLLEQCAYEIWKDGYDAFEGSNAGFETFLTKGDHLLRKDLFKALARMTAARNPMDPATGPNYWKARAFEQDDVEATTQDNVDVISIDD